MVNLPFYEIESPFLGKDTEIYQLGVSDNGVYRNFRPCSCEKQRGSLGFDLFPRRGLRRSACLSSLAASAQVGTVFVERCSDSVQTVYSREFY